MSNSLKLLPFCKVIQPFVYSLEDQSPLKGSRHTLQYSRDYLALNPSLLLDKSYLAINLAAGGLQL